MSSRASCRISLESACLDGRGGIEERIEERDLGEEWRR